MVRQSSNKADSLNLAFPENVIQGDPTAVYGILALLYRVHAGLPTSMRQRAGDPMQLVAL